MRLLQQLKKDTTWFFLIGVAFFYFILKLPSFFEPYWYGDEGVYEIIGFALRHGRALYSGIWDNKPPLVYIIYAIFNGEQFWVRIFAFIIELIAVFMFFFLSQKLLKKIKTAYIVTVSFSVFLALPLLEGNIANAENFMILPTIVAALLTVAYAKKQSEQEKMIEKNLLLPGLLIGISFLVKVVAVFDFAAFFLFIFFITYKNIALIPKQVKMLVSFVTGFFLPLFFTAAYFLLTGHLFIFIQSAFLSNVNYVGYGNQFIIPQGLLFLKLAILVIVCIYFFIKRRAFSLSVLFIFLWTAFSVFNMFFSQRPYTHYILVLLPSLMLLIGLAIEEQDKKLKNLFVAATTIVIFITCWIFSLYKDLPHKTIDYYTNFLSFVLNQESTEKYYAFFDPNTPHDYAISSFINLNKNNNDSLYIWGNNAQVYRLTNMLPPGKFVVAYHVTISQQNTDETNKALKVLKPRFIITSLHMNPPIPFSLENYTEKYIIGNFAVYEKVY